MQSHGWIASSLLFLSVAGAAAGLATWKLASRAEAEAAAARHPEPMESVTVAVAASREHRPSATAIGTVLALRSVTLRNEVPGTVADVRLEPGRIVEEGAVLVRLDTSVEEAELQVQEAEAALAASQLARLERAGQSKAASALEVDRARAERDAATAQITRVKAVIARKVLRAPFRARTGLADLHPGQYLDAGTVVTTLQGVDDAVHVDFSVAERVAAALREGDPVEVLAGSGPDPVPAVVVALDARIDTVTRNALVRARIEGQAPGLAPGAPGFAPGSAVRVRVPAGPPREAVVIPGSAVRKGPEGDHVFVIEPDGEGRTRARQRAVRCGTILGDEIVVDSGLAAGEIVANLGSFKLREAALVAVAGAAEAATAGGR